MKKVSDKETFWKMCEFRRSNKGSNRGMQRLPADNVLADRRGDTQAQILLLPQPNINSHQPENGYFLVGF